MVDFMELRRLPFSQILQDRKIFTIFDEEFQKGMWLDVAALVGSESSIDDAYKDGTIPEKTLDHIVARLEEFEQD